MENDIVERAENVIKTLRNRNPKNGKEEIPVTKTQIRKILTAVNLLKNKVDVFRMYNHAVQDINKDLAMEVKFLKVSVAYQAGRDNKVRKFVECAAIEKEIQNIGKDIKKFYEFCRYIEALVAYHKYYGGRD